MVNCVSGGIISPVTDSSYGGANIQRELMAAAQHDSNPKSASIGGAINNEGSFVGANNVEMVTAQNGVIVLKGISVTQDTEVINSFSPKTMGTGFLDTIKFFDFQNVLQPEAPLPKAIRGRFLGEGHPKSVNTHIIEETTLQARRLSFPVKDFKILLISQQRLRL
ncbi:hypothetical protein LIER_10556 [Lithospermum erythrorhizon]|uniref:Uncharacterized protein n=1 Tax=Lithospermum erythrorhizon TaxID=34254 RepID=A0AAV3PNR4_LITER